MRNNFKQFQNKFFMLVGNIGSGKSTFAKKLATKENCIIISRDAIRYMFGGGKYLFDPNIEHIVATSTIQLLEDCMRYGINIILDEVHCRSEIREKYLKIAKEYKYTSIAYVMKLLSKKVSVNRRMKNQHGKYSRETWESVWERFNCFYETPTKKEGFKKIIKL